MTKGDLRVPMNYSDIAVPDWAEKGLSGEGYNRYISWLTNRLWAQPISPDEAQRRYIESLRDKSPESIILQMVDTMTYNYYEEEFLREFAVKDTPFDEVEKGFRKMVVESDREAGLETEDLDAQTVTREEYEQVRREIIERAQISQLPPHLDIGIRGILSAAVRGCENLAHAESVIRGFFSQYQFQMTK